MRYSLYIIQMAIDLKMKANERQNKKYHVGVLRLNLTNNQNIMLSRNSKSHVVHIYRLLSIFNGAF